MKIQRVSSLNLPISATIFLSPQYQTFLRPSDTHLQLFIYVVKSLRPVEVEAVEITNEGLRFDRQYVLVKPPTEATHGLAE